MKVGGVLMASGAGRRFGGNKLLCPVEGVPMVERAFAAAPAELFTRACVVSCYPEILDLAGERGYLPVSNPYAAQGQSASIRLGLSRLTDLDGVMFCVCDQPWLRRASVERLLEQFLARPDRICALSWQGTRGSPVIFPAHVFPDLLRLTEDQGGRKVIQANVHRLHLVEAHGPEELLDLDTPSDLRRPTQESAD